MVEEIKKSSTTKAMTEKEKEKAKLAAQKQKEKEKAKLAAQKQKEKEKAKLAAQKQKEKEKAKLAAQKQKEKEKAKLAAQKEKAKQTSPKTSTSKTTSNTSSVRKSTSTIKTNPTKKVEKVEAVEKIEVSEKEIVKKDINQLFESKKKNIDDLPKNEDGIFADEKPSDHVAILRKKMEAQKKLKENANPLEKDPIEDSVSTDAKDLLNSKIKQLEETIAMLTDEVKDKDALINKQDLEIKDKSDQIIILTNSIVSKTNEADLVKELELLKKENESLKIELEEQIKVNAEVKTEVKEQLAENRVDINSPDVQEIIAQGDILLRIKLLDQRIQEKEAKIQLFEDELNKLTEADIQTSDFKQEIKVLRENRRSFVNSTNDRLTELTKLISKDEEKLNKRKAEYNAKGEEIKQFDKELKEKKLTIAQKEKEMKVRSRLVAEYDSLAIKINEIEDYFKKTILQYKNELVSAEKKVEELNSYENQLIESNLQKIREQRTSSNKDYKDDVETRSGLLVELDKLTQIYEEMKNNNLATEAENENVELNAIKKEYAKLAGKINLIEVRYNERVNVEEVLRTIDPDVSSYLKAFEEREKLLFDINELNNKINDEKCDNKEHLELLINDYQSRVNYLEVIINKNEDHEKVVFYKQLLKSMAEIKEKEADIRAKAKLLKAQIDAMDNVE